MGVTQPGFVLRPRDETGYSRDQPGHVSKLAVVYCVKLPQNEASFDGEMSRLLHEKQQQGLDGLKAF